MTAPMRLFIITGDHSGDMHAAKVVRALRTLDPEIELAAVGGKYLQEEGVELISDQSKMGRVGFGSVLGAPYHYMLGRKILNFLEGFKPDAVLHIDYGVFNLWMAKQLKRRGIRTFYFIPPQVWATRKGRIKKIKASIDHVFCIFPFEESMYREHGIPVTYVGHPLVGELPPPADRNTFCREHGLDPEKPIVGIFPGSRKLEIDYLLKPLMASIPLIRKQYPEAQFVIAKAISLDRGFFNSRYTAAIQGFDAASIKVVEGHNHAVLSVSDLAIVKSGTTTLEAAMYKTPMILIYRLHPIVYQIAIRLMQLPCMGLPNILNLPDLHAKTYTPTARELWQDEVNPAEITQAVLPLFDQSSLEYQRAMTGFEQIERLLNVGEAPANVAKGILDLLKS